MTQPALHVCIVSWEYGFGHGPEGICTERLVQALVGQGVKVTVITAEQGSLAVEPTALLTVKRVSSLPFSPGFLWKPVEKILTNWRLFGANYHFFWQSRVLRLPLPAGVQVIYGRSMPLSGCLVARRLALKHRLPLLVHFSDPPISPWFTPAPMPLRLLRRFYRNLVRDASAVSFVTAETIGYCEAKMGIPLSGKAFVLSHVAPPPMPLPLRQLSAAPVLVYAGSFYGMRSPAPLLAGFARLLATVPAARFRFVGSAPDVVISAATALGVQDHVEVLPPTRDLARAFADADVLLALDAFEGEPVFLSTKVVDYLMTNRPVLLVSPAASPGAKLLTGLGPTVRTVDASAEPMATALSQLLAMRAGENGQDLYTQRWQAMTAFSGVRLARDLLDQVQRAGAGK